MSESTEQTNAPDTLSVKRRAFAEAPLLPDPLIEAYKKDVDRSLLRENLKLTPEQRVRKLIGALRFAEECQKASGRKPR